jgi:hypothetical protein
MLLQLARVASPRCRFAASRLRVREPAARCQPRAVQGASKKTIPLQRGASRANLQRAKHANLRTRS